MMKPHLKNANTNKNQLNTPCVLIKVNGGGGVLSLLFDSYSADNRFFSRPLSVCENISFRSYSSNQSAISGFGDKRFDDIRRILLYRIYKCSRGSHLHVDVLLKNAFVSSGRLDIRKFHTSLINK
jgi:hypothetical protein